jgi:hypothetical protein
MEFNKQEQNEPEQNEPELNELKKEKLKIFKIKSFNLVDIKQNSLILCDIDDTILRYQYNMDYFIEKSRREIVYITDNFNEEDIKFLAECEYEDHRYFTEPFYTDKEGFDNMLKKISETNSNLIFITARSNKSREKTKNQLEKIGIDINNYPIHFTFEYKISKAEYIKKYIYLTQFDNIYFIDDQVNNVKNVKITFPNFNCYLFKYI